MAEINIQEATEAPADLSLSSPEISQVEIPFLKRVFSNQSWSTMMASNFIMTHENDLRDNGTLADVISASISMVEKDVTPDELDALYDASVLRREEIELDPIDEVTYDNQRDPKLLNGFALDVLDAMGFKSEFHPDLTTEDLDERIVTIEDDSVEDNVVDGEPSSIEDQAETIAIELGLEHIPDETDSNLIVPTIFETDSTDPYVKKVID